MQSISLLLTRFRFWIAGISGFLVLGALLVGNYAALELLVVNQFAGRSSSFTTQSVGSVGVGVSYQLFDIRKGRTDPWPTSLVDTPESQLFLVDEGVVSTISLKMKTPADHFLVRFDGYIYIPTDGTYEFALYSDDGSILWLDGQKVVVNDGVHRIRKKSSGPLQLTAGFHEISVHYFEYTQRQTLSMTWQGPGFSRQIVPTSVLYPKGTTPPPPSDCVMQIDAGPDKTITLPRSMVSVQATASCPGSFQWSQVSGPSTYSFSYPTSLSTDIRDLILAGTYVFRLTVTDDAGGQSFDDMVVTVLNAPDEANMLPEVNAGSDQTVVLPTNSVTIAGTATDTDGVIASTVWTQVSGPSATIVNTSTLSTQVSNLQAGTYVFRLSATDNDGGTSFDEVMVTVQQPINIPPSANAGLDQTITLPTSSVTLNGSATDSDGAGTIVGYQWKQLSGPSVVAFGSATQSSTTVSGMAKAGLYTFRLTVTDNVGDTGSDDMTVTVNAEPTANTPPVVNAGPDQTITLPMTTATLQGIATDSDGIASYAWVKVSCPASCALSPPNASSTTVGNLSIAGTYVFRLTAKDNKGATASDEVSVIVQPNNTPPPPPSSFVPTYYVSPSGGGNGSSASSPMSLKQALTTVKAGESIGLMDGVYKGVDNMLLPPSGKAGTANSPITIKAINDGKAIIDGEGVNNAVSLVTGNNYFVLEGFDVRNGAGVSLVLVKDSTGNVIRRVVATNQYQYQMENAFRTWNAQNTLFEDVAAIGYFRKSYSTSQGSTNTMFRRAFADRKGSRLMGPKHLFALAYNSDRTHCENCIGTIDNLMPVSYELLNSNKTPSGDRFQNSEIQQPNNGYGHDGQDGGYVVTDVNILGSLFFQPGDKKFWQSSKYRAAPFTVEIPNFTLKDNVSFIEPGYHNNMWNVALSSNGIVTNLTQVGGSLNHIGSNRTQTNNFSSSTCDLVQGGHSIVDPNPTVTQGKGAVIMKRYKDGVLTTENLWPWPMDGRIQTATAREGYTSYSLTDRIFGLCGGTKPDFGGGNPPPANTAPIVNAGTDKTITQPANAVTLAGTASDSDGIKTIQWTAVVCPSGSCSFSAPSSLQTTVAGLSTVGTYTFRLTVTDNLGLSNSDDIIVTVNATSSPNIPPSVDAGLDQTTTASSITLYGNATAGDVGSSISSKVWTIISKPAGSSPILTSPLSYSTMVINMTVPGTYQFQLTVVDNKSFSASDTVTVTVNSSSGSPDLNTIIATAKQWVSASPSQRSQYEAVLQSVTDSAVIDQVIAQTQPNQFTETAVGVILNQKINDPEFGNKYADVGYHMYVPLDYTPDKEMGVIIYLHGGGTCTTYSGDMNHLEVFEIGVPLISRSYPRPQTDTSDYILVTPMGPCGSLLPVETASRWNVPSVKSYLEDLLLHLGKRYNLNENKRGLVGFSMGGIGAGYLALAANDKRAAVLPAGRSRNIAPWSYLKDMPMFIMHGINDAFFNSPSSCREHRTAVQYSEIAHQALSQASNIHELRLFNGGHVFDEDGIWPTFINGKQGWVVNKVRNPYRSRVVALSWWTTYLEGGNYNVTWTAPKTPKTMWITIDEEGPGTILYDHANSNGINTCSSYEARNSWTISAEKIPVHAGMVEANILANNTISVTTQNVKQFSVWVHPLMGLNLNAPITVIVNGVSHQYTATPTLLTALKSFDASKDRGMIYHGIIQNIPGDVP